MRKMLLLSTVLFGVASAGFAAHAQVAPQEPTGTAVAPPAKSSAPAARKPMHRAMRHPAHKAAATSVSGIRPGHEPGVGNSYPESDKASNTTAADTRSQIAPRLPTPAGGENASIPTYLRDAQTALNSRQSGRAQEALERAETAMLQRSVPPDQAATPDQAPDVVQVEAARKAVASGNMAAAKKAVAAAMTPGQ